MSNFSAEIFLWTILQLWLNEYVWNYYIHQKECVELTSQLKKLMRLKYLILETPYTFFSIFSWYFIVLHTFNFLSPIFSGINNDNFSFFGL